MAATPKVPRAQRTALAVWLGLGALFSLAAYLGVNFLTAFFVNGATADMIAGPQPLPHLDLSYAHARAAARGFWVGGFYAGLLLLGFSTAGCLAPERWARRRVSFEAWLALGLLGWGITTAYVGERLPVNGGFGWDGSVYGNWTKDFYGLIAHSPVDVERLYKMLPSAILYHLMLLLHVPRTTETVVFAFQLLNAAMMAAAAWMLLATLAVMKVSAPGRLTAFAAVFVNYAAAKYFFYYATLPDCAGLFFGVAMLCCYLTRRFVALWATALVGMLAWKQVFYGAALLYIFAEYRPPVAWRSVRAHALVPVAVIAGFVLLLSSLHLVGRYPHPLVTPISTLVATATVGLSAWLCSQHRGHFDPKSYWTWTMAWRVATVVILYEAMAALINFIPHTPAVTTESLFVVTTVLRAIELPAVFVVGHLAFFGLGFALILALFAPLAREMAEFDRGLMATLASAVFFGLDSESRHAMHVFPILAAFAVIALERRRAVTWTWALGFFGLSLVLSKFWVYQNSSATAAYVDQKYVLLDMLQYFLNFGPWIPPSYYAGYLLLMIVLVAALKASIKALPLASETNASRPEFGGETVGASE
jgi:hypothetical protein